MQLTANALYGGPVAMQPSATPMPTHGPGEPEPVARTATGGDSKAAKLVGRHDPILVLVALLGLAMLLVQLSVRVELSA
jgi:hypothetical protein